MMKDKNIVVGVTAGIAAYKAAELVRLLVGAGARTRVAMTENATRFVTPLTFEALSGERVVWDMWNSGTSPMDHITWGQEADLVIIAPATADFIGKMAHGIGDDFLSTMIIATTAKILVCPSMNDRMVLNPTVRENINRLKERGYTILEPAEGELACGSEGPGRLQDPDIILEQAGILLSRQDLSGMRVLVTAGPTIEPIDPVRYITNRSSGKMGFALARMASQRGATVTLVSGPTELRPPYGIALDRVKTTEEMREAVLTHSRQSDVIIKAAAVSDYRPRERAAQKIKKGDDHRSLEMVPNPDILAELGAVKDNSRWILVGFAAETEALIANAEEKLRRKNLDLIVANDVSRMDSGFQTDTNRVKIIFRDGQVEDLPLLTKEEVADHLLDRIKGLWKEAT